MKFGILCAPHWPHQQTQQSVYEDVIGHIQLAEELGLWSAWTTEHHFGTDPAYKPYGLEGPWPAYDLVVDPLTFLGHVAARTTRIRLGTGVLVVHYDDPLRMAERAAMVDVLSGGRLELGLGRGGGVREPKAFNVPSDEEANRDKYFEALDVMRAAWTGKHFKHSGVYYDYPEVQVVPTPLQRPIPAFLSNRNTRSIAYAAEHGMSYVSVTSSWGDSGIDSHNAYHAKFEELAVSHGRSIEGLDYPQTLFCYIAPTDEEAIGIARTAIQARNAYAEAHYETRRRVGNVQSPLSVPAHQGPPSSQEQQFQEQLKTNLIGSPKTVIEKLTALRERLPTMNYVLAIVGAGAAPIEFDRRSLRLLAEEVMPHFS